MSTTDTDGDPFAARQRLTESMREKNAALLGAVRNVDHNGAPIERRRDPARSAAMSIVMRGDTTEVGRLVDDLMDKIDRLEAARTGEAGR